MNATTRSGRRCSRDSLVQKKFEESNVIVALTATDWNQTLCRGNLGDNFQRRNLVPFELEKESKVNGAAGKISNQVAGDNNYPVLLFARDRLAGVFVFGRSPCLPLLDRRPALVGVSLILHDGIFSETLRERFAVIFVRREVGRDGFWQI